MSKIASLSKARKARNAAAKRKEADNNSIRYGTPKALRDAAKSETDRNTSQLDGHLRPKG